MDAYAASDTALDIFQFIGTIAFAISGALVAGNRKMDWFGVVVLAVIVAVGGGSLRDLLLGVTPVFWVETPWYVLLAALTALLAIPVTRRQINYQNYLLLSDAAGLAVFTVLGTEKALSLGTSAFVAVIMGVITGIVGGIFRDLLANSKPTVLYGGFYASAALIGCAIYVLLLQVGANSLNALWISIGIIFVLRLIAIIRNWSVPQVDLEQQD